MQKSNKHHNKQNHHPHSIEVTFALECAEAKDVYVSGDFNGWSATSLQMTRQNGNGRWEQRLKLPPGRYQYKFIVDGKWIADPQSREDIVNSFGSINSVLEVHL